MGVTVGSNWMSIDNHANSTTVEGANEHPPVGEDFQTDLIRIGHVVQSAFEDVSGEHNWDTCIAGLMNELETEDVPPEEAIVAAWLFILDFAE